jgi:hypothetical protein
MSVLRLVHGSAALAVIFSFSACNSSSTPAAVEAALNTFEGATARCANPIGAQPQGGVRIDPKSLADGQLLSYYFKSARQYVAGSFYTPARDTGYPRYEHIPESRGAGAIAVTLTRVGNPLEKLAPNDFRFEKLCEQVSEEMRLTANMTTALAFDRDDGSSNGEARVDYVGRGGQPLEVSNVKVTHPYKENVFEGQLPASTGFYKTGTGEIVIVNVINERKADGSQQLLMVSEITLEPGAQKVATMDDYVAYFQNLTDPSNYDRHLFPGVQAIDEARAAFKKGASLKRLRNSVSLFQGLNDPSNYDRPVFPGMPAYRLALDIAVEPKADLKPLKKRILYYQSLTDPSNYDRYLYKGYVPVQMAFDDANIPLQVKTYFPPPKPTN